MRMKKLVLFAAFCLLVLAGCKQAPVNPVAGAWNLIYAKTVSNDTVIDSYPEMHQGSQVKMWCNNYWMFIGVNKNDTTVIDKFGGGSYTLDGVVYKETIAYHYTKSYVGQTLGMRIVVENDTLMQVWPADDQGNVDKSNYFSEKYVRIK